jgi:hypothetical protein
MTSIVEPNVHLTSCSRLQELQEVSPYLRIQLLHCPEIINQTNMNESGDV